MEVTPSCYDFWVGDYFSGFQRPTPQIFFSDFENFKSNTPNFNQNFQNFRLFWLQIIFLSILWCFEQKSLFQILKKNLSPKPQILTKIFDFFCCKTFFCPFYDVLSKKKLFAYTKFSMSKKKRSSILYEKLILSNQFSNTSRDIHPVKLYLKFESICIIGW